MFKIITIPFDRNKKGFDEEALTKFILNKQVISHHVQFFEDGTDKYWSVFLEYDPVLEKAPEKEAEGLDEPQTILLERLRAWRKERAEKDGVPVYIIGTNKELVNIVPRPRPALRPVIALHVIIHELGIASRVSILFLPSPSAVYFLIPGSYKETP